MTDSSSQAFAGCMDATNFLLPPSFLTACYSASACQATPSAMRRMHAGWDLRYKDDTCKVIQIRASEQHATGHINPLRLSYIFASDEAMHMQPLRPATWMTYQPLAQWFTLQCLLSIVNSASGNPGACRPALAASLMPSCLRLQGSLGSHCRQQSSATVK